LRLETGPNLDKEKSELYFLALVKKFLTETLIKASPKMLENLLASAIERIDPLRHFRATNAARCNTRVHEC